MKHLVAAAPDQAYTVVMYVCACMCFTNQNYYTIQHTCMYQGYHTMETWIKMRVFFDRTLIQWKINTTQLSHPQLTNSQVLGETTAQFTLSLLRWVRHMQEDRITWPSHRYGFTSQSLTVPHKQLRVGGDTSISHTRLIIAWIKNEHLHNTSCDGYYCMEHTTHFWER